MKRQGAVVQISGRIRPMEFVHPRTKEKVLITPEMHEKGFAIFRGPIEFCQQTLERNPRDYRLYQTPPLDLRMETPMGAVQHTVAYPHYFRMGPDKTIEEWVEDKEGKTVSPESDLQVPESDAEALYAVLKEITVLRARVEAISRTAAVDQPDNGGVSESVQKAVQEIAIEIEHMKKQHNILANRFNKMDKDWEHLQKQMEKNRG